MIYLTSIFVYIMLALSFIVCAITYIPFLLKLGPRKTILLRILFARIVMASCFCKTVIKDNCIVPKNNGPYIYVFNHQSFWDIFIVASVIQDHVTAIGKKEILTIPLFGYIIRKYEVIFIDRSNHEDSMRGIMEAVEIIKSGTSVIVFPEGTRVMGEGIREFKFGAFKLAKESQATIIPCYISGVERVFPKRNWLTKPGTFYVQFGKPIIFEEYNELTIPEITRSTREKILELKNY